MTIASGTETTLQKDLARLFSFVLTFAAYTREQAFQITVEASLKTIEGERRSPDRVRIELFREALMAIRRRPPAGSADLRSFVDVPSVKAPAFSTIRRALLKMREEDRAPLLLRDQCHFSLRSIGAMLDTDERDARSLVDASRERFRAELRALLGSPHGL